jgi:diadenylate cyclase
MEALGELGTEELVDLKTVADVLRLPDEANELDASVQPRGYRLLSKIPRLPDPVVDHLVHRFGNLQKLLRATIDELDDVEGIGGVRARAIKEGLSRLAETSILDRYS